MVNEAEGGGTEVVDAAARRERGKPATWWPDGPRRA
jgi:hypothetical protein